MCVEHRHSHTHSGFNRIFAQMSIEERARERKQRERERAGVEREIFDALLSGSLNASYAIGIFNCLIAAKFLLG